MLTPEDFETIPENSDRHCYNDTTRVIVLQLAAEFRKAVVDLEKVLNYALDNDELLDAACRRSAQTEATLDQYIKRYLATRDIQGVA